MADTSTPGFGADAAGACARTAAGNRRNERVIPIFMVIPTEDSDFSASARSARTSKRRCEPQAGARTRNPSVRQDRSDRRDAEKSQCGNAPRPLPARRAHRGMRLAAKDAQGVLGEFFAPMRFARRGSRERGEVRKTRVSLRLGSGFIVALRTDRGGGADDRFLPSAFLASRQATKNDGLPHPRYNRLLDFETDFGGFSPLARIA